MGKPVKPVKLGKSEEEEIFNRVPSPEALAAGDRLGSLDLDFQLPKASLDFYTAFGSLRSPGHHPVNHYVFLYSTDCIPVFATEPDVTTPFN